jgi:hypothetical protein
MGMGFNTGSSRSGLTTVPRGTWWHACNVCRHFTGNMVLTDNQGRGSPHPGRHKVHVSAGCLDTVPLGHELHEMDRCRS